MTDTPINPKTPIVNSDVVGLSNQIPVTLVGSPGTDTGAIINPVTWVFNGSDASDANPIALTSV